MESPAPNAVGRMWNGLCPLAPSKAAVILHPLQDRQDVLPARAAAAALVTRTPKKAWSASNSSKEIGKPSYRAEGPGLYRIGFGYDAHRLEKGKPLILGGVEIPFEKGLVGYSDADVLTHAVIDALIGALGEGDIGTHFPDSDPAFKGVSSLWMLQKVFERTCQRGYRVQNLDATIVAEAPRLAPFASTMRQRISHALDTTLEQVNIKAKTTEGMGSCGRGEGMEAFAILSLVSGL